MKKRSIFKFAGTVLMIVCFFIPVWAGNTYTLEQCKKLALENSVKVKNADLEVSASDEVKKAAFTNFFPKISGMGTVFKNSRNLFEMSLGEMSISMLDRVTFGGITAVQPIFAGGRIITGNKLAGLGKEVNEKKLRLDRNEIYLKTEEDFWVIISLDEKMKTLILYGEMLDNLYKQANDAYNAGIITNNDLLKVSVKRSEMALSKQKLENGKNLASMAFCHLIGIPYDPDMKLSGQLEVVGDPQQIYVSNDDAVKNRLEYSLLRDSVRAEKLKSALKRGEYLPEIGIGFSGYYLNMLNKTTFNTAVFCSVSVPVSGWWEASHLLKEKKIREKIAENTMNDTGELLKIQAQKAWYELTESFKEISFAEEWVTQAEENLKVNRDNYEQGIVPISDLLDAQALAQQAKAKLIDAKTGNRVKWNGYLHVTGRYNSASR